MEPLHHPNQDYNTSDASLDLGADAEAKEKHRRLFQRGLRWLGAGVSLMAISFGVNFLLFHSDTSFTTVMYTLTSLGTLCLVKGLADILGF